MLHCSKVMQLQRTFLGGGGCFPLFYAILVLVYSFFPSAVQRVKSELSVNESWVFHNITWFKKPDLNTTTKILGGFRLDHKNWQLSGMFFGIVYVFSSGSNCILWKHYITSLWKEQLLMGSLLQNKPGSFQQYVVHFTSHCITDTELSNTPSKPLVQQWKEIIDVNGGMTAWPLIMFWRRFSQVRFDSLLRLVILYVLSDRGKEDKHSVLNVAI